MMKKNKPPEKLVPPKIVVFKGGTSPTAEDDMLEALKTLLNWAAVVVGGVTIGVGLAYVVWFLLIAFTMKYGS